MSQFFKPGKASTTLSLPKTRRVRGCEIKRMPLGAYLEAMEALKDFPSQALEALFPGQGLEEILTELKGIDTSMIAQLMVRAMAALPAQAVRLVASLTGIPEETLLTDASIGLDGFGEIIQAWLEINGIENFMAAAGAVMNKAKALAANTGYSG